MNRYKKFEIVNLKIMCTISNFYMVKVFWQYYNILILLFYFLAIQPFPSHNLYMQSLS